MLNKNGEKKKVQMFSFQMKCLTIFSVFMVLITIGLVVLIIYNSYCFIFMEIAKLYDLNDFQKLYNIENNLENIQLNLESYFKNTLQTIVNLYKDFGEFNAPNEYYSDSEEIKIIKLNDVQESDDPKDNMIYFSNENEMPSDDKKAFLLLGTYLKNIFNDKNINNAYLHLLLICDYDKQITYFYPGYKSKINNEINKDTLKIFTQKKIVQKIDDFIAFKNILLHDIDYYNNLFLLPYYEDDNYSIKNDLVNLTKEIFNSNDNETLKISNIAFMLLPKNEDINYNNLEENIGKIFFLIGIENTAKLFHDEIKYKHQITDINILRTNYLFPYELVDDKSCKNILYIGKDLDNIEKEYKYLDNCFDKEETLNDFGEGLTSYDKILDVFSLYRNIMENEEQYDSNVFNLYRAIEKKKICEINTSFNKSLVNITLINNENCKAIKAYSPLQIIYETDYFYPIYNTKLHLIILNEESINDLLEKIENIGNKKLLIGSLFTLLAAVLYLIAVIILLFYTQNEIRKPMKRMNVLNNLYSGQDNDKGLYIDEFEEIIKSIIFELKYDTDYLNSGEKQEDEKTKLEMENFNKDFEKNKIYNILVDKERINKILEETNYSNEIINNVNISKIQNDSYVKKSTLFRECIQMGDFSKLDNYEEYNNIISKEIHFRDKNTLQNQNALFYKIFKKEFFKKDFNDDNNFDIDTTTKKVKKNKIKKNLFKDNEDNNKDDENNIINEI